MSKKAWMEITFLVCIIALLTATLLGGVAYVKGLDFFPAEAPAEPASPRVRPTGLSGDPLAGLNLLGEPPKTQKEESTPSAEPAELTGSGPAADPPVDTGLAPSPEPKDGGQVVDQEIGTERAVKKVARKRKPSRVNRNRAKQIADSAKSGQPAAAQEEAPANAPPNTLSRVAIAATMKKVESRARGCRSYGPGTVLLKITVIGATGAVQSAQITDAPAIENIGRCVAYHARLARFPTFTAPSQTFEYKIVLAM